MAWVVDHRRSSSPLLVSTGRKFKVSENYDKEHRKKRRSKRKQLGPRLGKLEQAAIEQAEQSLKNLPAETDLITDDMLTAVDSSYGSRLVDNFLEELVQDGQSIDSAIEQAIRGVARIDLVIRQDMEDALVEMAAFYSDLHTTHQLERQMFESALQVNVEVEIACSEFITRMEEDRSTIIEAIVETLASAERTGLQLMRDYESMFQSAAVILGDDMDRYHLDINSILPLSQSTTLPVEVITSGGAQQAPEESIREALHGMREELDQKLEELKREVQGAVPAGGEEPEWQLRVSYGSVKSGSSKERTAYLTEISVKSNTLTIFTKASPIGYVLGGPNMQQLMPGDVTDKKVILLDERIGKRQREQALDKSLLRYEGINPLLDTRGLWWLDEDHSLVFATHTEDNTDQDGRITFPFNAKNPTKQYRLMYLLCSQYKKGVSARDFATEVYPEFKDTYLTVPEDGMKFLGRARGLVSDIGKKFVRAGLNPAILPKVWMKTRSIRLIGLQLAGLLSVEEGEH
jgi:hypothetical protein